MRLDSRRFEVAFYGSCGKSGGKADEEKKAEDEMDVAHAITPTGCVGIRPELVGSRDPVKKTLTPQRKMQK